MESDPKQSPAQPEEQQLKPPKKWSWRKYIITSLIQITTLMMLYVLSIGPFFWQWYASYNSMSSPFFAIFYTPLVLACDLISPLSDGVNWYINFWIS